MTLRGQRSQEGLETANHVTRIFTPLDRLKLLYIIILIFHENIHAKRVITSSAGERDTISKKNVSPRK